MVHLQPIDYQWYRDNDPIEGANSYNYAVSESDSSHNGSYVLKMSNEAGVDWRVIPHLSKFMPGWDIRITRNRYGCFVVVKQFSM